MPLFLPACIEVSIVIWLLAPEKSIGKIVCPSTEKIIQLHDFIEIRVDFPCFLQLSTQDIFPSPTLTYKEEIKQYSFDLNINFGAKVGVDHESNFRVKPIGNFTLHTVKLLQPWLNKYNIILMVLGGVVGLALIILGFNFIKTCKNQKKSRQIPRNEVFELLQTDPFLRTQAQRT